MPITHTFVSPKSDGADITLVRPSNWNASHTIATFGTPIMIAASNATAAEKEFATATGGAICDGTNDEVQLNAVSGFVELSSGTFQIQNAWNVPSNTIVRGSGNITILNFDVGVNSYINVLNVDNVELGNFKTSGSHHAGGDRYPLLLSSQDGATHSNFYFHDIYSTDLVALGDFVIWLDVSNSKLSNVIYERCQAISPDGFGFYNNAGVAGNTISNLIYEKCYVKNAGVAATRSNIWATGFGFAEAGVLTIQHVQINNCIVDGAWESGYHMESAPTKIDVKFSNCSAYNCGLKTAGLFIDHVTDGTLTGYATGAPITLSNHGTIAVTGAGTFKCTPLSTANGGSISTLIYSGTATVSGSPVYCAVDSTTTITVSGTGSIKYKGGPDFGAGFCCSGDVSLINCNSYDCYHDLLLDGTGTSNIEATNFKGYRSVGTAIAAGSGVSGDIYKMIGGGIYSSISNCIVLSTITPTRVLFQGMEIISPTDDTASGYAVALLSSNVIVDSCFIKTAGIMALYSNAGAGIQIINNTIPASSVPIYMANTAVTNLVVSGNNTNGSSADMTLNNAGVSPVTPLVTNNIDYQGNPYAGNNYGAQSLLNNFTTTNTGATSTNLSFLINNGDIVDVDVWGTCSKATSAEGLKFAVACPTSCTIKGIQMGGGATLAAPLVPSTITAINTLGTAMATGVGVEVAFELHFRVVNSTTAGSITIQAATVTANTATVYAGTKMIWNKVVQK
jgi:hypothetical protein